MMYKQKKVGCVLSLGQISFVENMHNLVYCVLDKTELCMNYYLSQQHSLLQCNNLVNHLFYSVTI